MQVCVCVVFTSLTAGQVSAPGQVPLAHEQLCAHQLETWVALVGDHCAMDQLRVGGALPSVGDLWELRTRVVTRYLCIHEGGREKESERKKATTLQSWSGVVLHSNE